MLVLTTDSTESINTYGERSAKPMKAKFCNVFGDDLKFWNFLCCVCVTNPTGIAKEEVMSTEIAKELQTYT